MREYHHFEYPGHAKRSENEPAQKALPPTVHGRPLVSARAVSKRGAGEASAVMRIFHSVLK